MMRVMKKMLQIVSDKLNHVCAAEHEKLRQVLERIVLCP
jgi:hypothetical protein